MNWVRLPSRFSVFQFIQVISDLSLISVGSIVMFNFRDGGLSLRIALN